MKVTATSSFTWSVSVCRPHLKEDLAAQNVEQVSEFKHNYIFTIISAVFGAFLQHVL